MIPAERSVVSRNIRQRQNIRTRPRLGMLRHSVGFEVACADANAGYASLRSLAMACLAV